MNRAMIRQLSEHNSAERVEVHPHEYNEPTNSMQLTLGLSWRAPPPNCGAGYPAYCGTGNDH